MSIIGESFAGVATSATRLIESYQLPDQRLFDDPYALKLLPVGWQVFFRLAYLPGLRSALLVLRERQMPGSLGAILCRTRYIDDVVRRSLEQGLDQVVILGAGFDSRAYRIAGMDQVRVFELDFPGSCELKETRLQQVLGAVPENVSLIGTNFEQRNLAQVLSRAGFQEGLRTMFIWEGVTQYLTAEAVDSTLEFVSRVSGAGSAIVFTYINQGLIDGSDRPEWMGTYFSFASRVGSPVHFGINPHELENYLSARGFKLVEDVGAAEYQERYLKPLGRELTVFAGERAVFAEVVLEKTAQPDKDPGLKQVRVSIGDTSSPYSV